MELYTGPERRRYDRRKGVPDAAWCSDLLFEERRQYERRREDDIKPTSREELLLIARRVLFRELP